MITRASVGIHKPNPRYALVIAPTEIFIPRSAKYALTILEWKEAMSNEFRALKQNNIWTLVPREAGDNVINMKWVYKIKMKEDGSAERFKGRLIANGMR